MKRNTILIAMLLLVLSFGSCVKDLEKEDIYTTTTYSGIVQEKSEQECLNNVSVYLVNGQSQDLLTTTDASGIFLFSLNTSEINDNSKFRFKLDGITSDIEIKGYGMKEYDYGIIYLYNKTADLPQIAMDSISNIGMTSATFYAHLLQEGDGAQHYGFLIDTIPDSFAMDTIYAELEIGNLSVSATADSLLPNTKYYVKAFASKDSAALYSDVMEFNTSDGKPIVETVGANVSVNIANCKGKVINNFGADIIEYGIYYSMEPSFDSTSTHQVCGNISDDGSFECTLELLSDTLYYYRAYAENEYGTGYGEIMQFETTSGTPVVETLGSSNIRAHSANITGKVTNDGACTILSTGFIYDDNYNFNHVDTIWAESTSMDFTCHLSNLDAGKQYFYKSIIKYLSDGEEKYAMGDANDFSTLNGIIVAHLINVDNITSNSATVRAETQDGGVDLLERGICWSTTPNPTINGESSSATNVENGEFEISIQDLQTSTTYYVRAYVKSIEGVAYSSQESFSTLANLPEVLTLDIMDIGITTASCQGYIVSDGGSNITERGICWSTEQNPTISGTHASNGTGTGSFTVQMTDLDPNTTYHVRSYAVNSAGTSYGEDKQFTTLENPAPDIHCENAEMVDENNCNVSGILNDNGCINISGKGFCWKLGEEPTIEDEVYETDGSFGSFTHVIDVTELPNGTYKVRAFAKVDGNYHYSIETVEFEVNHNEE